MTIIVPTDIPVTMGVSRMPQETPIGIPMMEKSVVDVKFGGCHYQLLGDPDNVIDQPAIDVETGDIVVLNFQNVI